MRPVDVLRKLSAYQGTAFDARQRDFRVLGKCLRSWQRRILRKSGLRVHQERCHEENDRCKDGLRCNSVHCRSPSISVWDDHHLWRLGALGVTALTLPPSQKFQDRACDDRRQKGSSTFNPIFLSPIRCYRWDLRVPPIYWNGYGSPISRLYRCRRLRLSRSGFWQQERAFP